MNQTKAQNKRASFSSNRIREVEIRIIFLRIGDIDTLNEKFFAEILIESRWEDPKLSIEFESDLDSSIIEDEKELNNPTKYWNPKIYVENSLNDPKQTVYYKIKKEILDVNADQNQLDTTQSKTTTKFWLYEYRKIKGHFFEKLDLQYFPLDVQGLSIIVTTFKSNKEVSLVHNSKKSSIINNNLTVDKNIWHLFQHVQSKSNYNLILKDELKSSDNMDTNISDKTTIHHPIKFPMIMFQCQAARRSGYFFWNAYFLIFLITSAVFSTFSIRFDQPHFRLPTTATLMLTSITFRWSYSSRCLPTVNYLTSLDKYSINSLILIFLCLVWHGLGVVFLNFFDWDTVKKLDKLFLTFLILFFISSHLILFIWLKSANSIRKALRERDNLYQQVKSSQSMFSEEYEIDPNNNITNNSKRFSVFSSINYIDAINSGKKFSMTRRPTILKTSLPDINENNEKLLLKDV